MVARVVMVMGVSGAGKTQLARALADRIGARYLEGDDFHPPENIATMRAGRPLTDALRAGWLAALANAVAAERDNGAVVFSCSALKSAYRVGLRAHLPGLLTLYLRADPGLLRRRLRAREGHFMPASLLDSQLSDLEPPDPSAENAVWLEADQPPARLLDLAVAAVARGAV